MGFLTDIPIGFPGYNGRIPRSAATLPRILRDAGYSHLRGRQVAPGTALGAVGVGTVRPLAARPRLRALLRVPERRHQPVDARAGERQRLRRPARDTRAGLSPHRGSRRSRHATGARPAAGDARQALLPLLRAGRDARAAPGAGRMDRRASAAATTAAGRRSAPRPSRASRSSASCVRARRCPSIHPGSRSGAISPRPSAGSTRA